MMQKVDAVVTLGEYWRDFVHDFLQVDASRIAVLHNAVPGPASTPERTGTGTCRILFLGVVCERKGVPTLLSALAHPALRALDWRVTMAGNGEVDFYRAEAERLGLSDRISFLGWVGETQARQLLAESDVLVLPSRNEGLPMAILEAMAYGLPVVATPVGSITDAIADGDTGLLVPVGDQEALARAILKLVENPSLRLHIGARAREQYLSMFDIAAFNRKLEHIFRQAKRQLPVS
jgi:glycosyltransferase involved in cell wall biosynthesis